MRQKIKPNEQFLNAVFNSIQDGISVLDTNLTIVNTNEAMQRLYSHVLPLEGKKCYETYRSCTEHCNPCPVLRCFKSKKLEMDHVPLQRPGEPDGTLELYAFPMQNENGVLEGVVEYIRDITKTKQIEKLLVIQRDLGICLGETLDLQQTLDACMEAILKIDDIHSAGIYLVDQEDGGLTLSAHKNLPSWFVNLAFDYDKVSPLAQLVMKEKSIFSSYGDILSRMGLEEKDINMKKGPGLRTLGLVPGSHEKKVIAVLSVFSKHTTQFQEAISTRS